MSVNISDEEYPSSRSPEEVESPRKRMRMDNSSRKSWSLMDRKTDHEVLQEMGVSILEPDDTDVLNDNSMHHHKPLKRKHNLENLNPNVILSPRKQSPHKYSPGAGPSKGKSPRSCDKTKPLTETNLDNTLITDCIIDEETPLGQVSTQYLPMPAAVYQTRQSYTPLRQQSSSAWEPSGGDAFDALSDEVMLGVLRWLPKRTLAHCMLLCKRWYRLACDETLWQRLDLGNKTLSKNALGRILARKPYIVRLASSEIGEWRPTTPPEPSRIQYLDLSMVTIDVTSLNHLLERCPLLRKLSLESVIVEDSTCQIIGRCKHLETLNLTMAQGITPEGLTHILQGCSNLQALNISWTKITEATLEVLVTLSPQRLQRLNLSGARVMTDDMVEALAARCPRLVELDLSDCSRLAQNSVRAAASLAHLEHLALSRCYLLPAAALAKLSGMVSLQYLEVWGMLQTSSLSALRATLPAIQINQFMFSAIARPTVGTRRTSIWGLRTRD